MLFLQNAMVEIGGHLLLDVSDLELKPGEVLGVVGPNGAGKSTLLNVLSGERTPTKGTVSMNGIDLQQWPSHQRAMTRAVLPQSSSLMFAFKVMDVVLIGRSPHSNGLATVRDREISYQAMEMTDTLHLVDRHYTDLSGGEKQRVHLARVLAQLWSMETDTAKYLLLDEPTSALDLSHQHQTLSIVRTFARQQNAGVLIILHDLNLASLYVDTLLMLKSGKAVAFGTPAAVLKADIVEHVFDYPVTVNAHPNHPDCPLIVASSI